MKTTTALVALRRLKGGEELIIYETLLLNDYVQLCHINAFYYGNMYIYCQCQNNSSTRLHFALFTTYMKWKVLRTGNENADFIDWLIDRPTDSCKYSTWYSLPLQTIQSHRSRVFIRVQSQPGCLDCCSSITVENKFGYFLCKRAQCWCSVCTKVSPSSFWLAPLIYNPPFPSYFKYFL